MVGWLDYVGGQLLIVHTDETTLLQTQFHLNVDKTIKTLEAQEATNGKFQITVEDLGPKVSLFAMLWGINNILTFE